ncbi:MAG: hypothetical protein BLM47_05355 [Candidatus Reconcilbacillus cellulovorans]|uniref:Carnitine transport ATP-binding protein OpuCA n=1 Tax=Candidatus Reconcilbacillus cellulovorans TaxID=1906605 RepID=A0A2A6E173_9BACL|nr:MAG: hypothetical protein BLM47_05355 [Candidatus Reconcilbacillus cellulovorans]
MNRLRKSFGKTEVVRDVSFTVEPGRLVALLGPSGGGKSTILRMLAGLEVPDGGEIRFDGRNVTGVPPQEREIGFVFQHYALFRHMTVFDNIAFGLEVRRVAKTDVRRRVAELVALTGLEGLERRLPHQLSGGQKQRVAFARALAPGPKLLLLDEPFAAVDAAVRKTLRAWLKETIVRIGVTTLFVTHDQEEALELADELMIIRDGRLEQQGTPVDVWRNPQTPFVAGFVGEAVRLDGAGWAALPGFAAWKDEGDYALVRPEFVDIMPFGGAEADSGGDRAAESGAESGVVRKIRFCGDRWRLDVEVGGMLLPGYLSSEVEAPSLGSIVGVRVRRLFVCRGDRVVVANRVPPADQQAGRQTGGSSPDASPRQAFEFERASVTAASVRRIR